MEIRDRLTTIVLATHNKGKIRELGALLEPFHLRVLGLESFPQVGEVEETGATFQENALLKACEVSRATGLVAVADDSGLEVDALDGAPGVYSARYSATADTPATDQRNLEKVLRGLADTPDERRTARFRCCMAACAPHGEHIVAQGAWEGRICRERAGHNGFGYDPVFFDPEKQCTAAQMSAEEKNSRSHRGKAVQALLAQWPAFWQAWVGKN
jgi:XTP/dITP diphosphohydrolase